MARKVARSSSGLSSLGTSYSNSVMVELKTSPTGSVFIGTFSLINIQCSNLSASPKPTKIYLSISEDTAGDEFIITETASDLTFGITTASKGTAIWRVEGVIALDLLLNDEVYCWVKTDKGTLDISEVTITWIGDR